MIFKTFTKRRLESSRSEQTDVFQYEIVSKKLRVQIEQILLDAIGRYYEAGPYDMSAPRHNNSGWDNIHRIICREMGVHYLSIGGNPKQDIIGYIDKCDIDGFLDVLDIVAAYLCKVIVDYPDYRLASIAIVQKPSEAIDEINHRLREHGLGYQIENGQVIKVDSQFCHANIIKPALSLITRPGFEGVQDEFFEAHQFYRDGDYKQAVVSAGKAFESALKAICIKKKWEYSSGARASDLLKIVRGNGLWPSNLDGSFDQLLATLTSGLPQVRNVAGAHGQGPIVEKVPEFIAAYAINLCAAKIILLIEASN